jgi:phosphoglycerate dehydrogenase-like enzyme
VQRSVIVLNQLGSRVGGDIAGVPAARVIDVPMAPEASTSVAGEVLLAAPRFDLDEEELASTPTPWADTVRWVHTASTRIDRYPRSMLAGRLVTCNRSPASIAVAEFVLAALLADVKHLPSVWTPSAPFATLDTLESTTLGVVGFGSVVDELARRADAFGMHVVASRHVDHVGRSSAVAVEPFLSVLARADHLVLADPAPHEIGTDELAAVKPGIHLVSVSRGWAVDSDALLVALEEDRVRRATVDLGHPSAVPAGHPLRRHPAVRLSNGVCWSSPALRDRGVNRFVQNLRRYLAGQPLLGLVDRSWEAPVGLRA